MKNLKKRKFAYKAATTQFASMRDTENGIVFLSENTTGLAFNPNIQLMELHGRIKKKFFGSNHMRVSLLKYQFCASVNPVRYDTFDIIGAKELETMVQTHIENGSPFLELYVKFSRKDEGPQRSTYVPVQRVET
ncbi:hypothetical protein PVK06_039853 [Gossypium arboreum]|uniref:Uncharacterized protein n=1 Tax=Gossypium arboreum TaxID=29729 RepID=A0ABR0N473_GOSAR|nr:hypothetical protein PVK06_039853 [Gossypium arboreum]